MKGSLVYLMAFALLGSVGLSHASGCSRECKSKKAEGSCAGTTVQEASAVPGTALQPQTTCPVMEGAPVSKSHYHDFKGKRIYVCCAGCVNEVKKDPKGYIKKLEALGQSVEAVPRS